MYQIPRDWVDKLFHCMGLFYKDKWNSLFKDEAAIEMAKEEWQKALYNLSYDDIKQTLFYCKCNSQDVFSKPPNSIEFFRWAKEKKIPDDRVVKRHISPVAIAAMNEIRTKLGMRRT